MSYPGPGKQSCPYCSTEMECDTVDVGVGLAQCGPYYCGNCGASEIGPEGRGGTGLIDSEERERKIAEFQATLDEDERRTGYYKSGKVSPHANTVGGTLVDHTTAKRLYEMGLLDPKPPHTIHDGKCGGYGCPGCTVP